LEILYFLIPERLERTIWISPLMAGINKISIEKKLEEVEKDLIKKEKSNLGIPLLISLKRPKKNCNERSRRAKINGFIEFIHPNSVNRMLKIASTSGISFFADKKVRIYKAGSKIERKTFKARKVQRIRRRKPKNSLLIKMI